MPTRRTFLMAAGATALAAGRVPAAPDVVRVGVIGTGGRARQLMKPLAAVPGVEIVALCDVWAVPLNLARPLAGAGATVTKDYADLLADKTVDAVLIGTPDHQHVPVTIAALKAGKDVYVEKPLTHDPAEAAGLVAAHAAAKRVVQVGMQQRSMPHVIRARELVQAGALGKVVKVQMSWNRNADRARKFALGTDPAAVDWPRFLGGAPAQPFDEYKFRNWRWFWDFGGGLFTDLMVHWVDVAHYLTGLDAPTAAVSVGSHLSAAGVWETPDTVQTVLSYPGGVSMHFEGTFSNARRGAHLAVLGTEASLYLDRGRLEVTPEKGKNAAAVSDIVGTGPPGADFYDKPDGESLHLANWIDCVRTRREPSAPVAAGVSAANAAHLANRALRAGGAARAR